MLSFHKYKADTVPGDSGVLVPSRAGVEHVPDPARAATPLHSTAEMTVLYWDRVRSAKAAIPIAAAKVTETTLGDAAARLPPFEPSELSHHRSSEVYILFVCLFVLETCNIVENARSDCGFHGITQAQCSDKGCCFDSSVADGVPHCYHSTCS